MERKKNNETFRVNYVKSALIVVVFQYTESYISSNRIYSTIIFGHFNPFHVYILIFLSGISSDCEQSFWCE